jgi:protoheme IX farnesyltransferase
MSHELTAESAQVADPEHAALALRRWGSLYMELGKARLSGLVVLTAAAGYAMAVPSTGRPADWALFFWMLLGTSLCAWSANALNQVIEVERDNRMPRTKGRPLPTGRIGMLHAAGLSIFAAGLGVTLLAAMVNPLTAALGLSSLLLYLIVYTPMKTRSTLNTLVGSVVGAIPPLMGWTAAAGELDRGAYVLASVLLVWQVPHFLALAWMYRRDYELGGYRMLPAVDPSGRITSQTCLIWCLALLPVAFSATLAGISGWFYGLGSLLLGAWMLKLSFALYRQRTDAAARKLFLASVLYLPLLMGLMVLDRPESQNVIRVRQLNAMSDAAAFSPAPSPQPLPAPAPGL